MTRMVEIDFGRLTDRDKAREARIRQASRASSRRTAGTHSCPGYRPSVRRGVRRLAIFAGPFSLEAAASVATSPEVAASDAIEGLLGLVAKSLVAAEVHGAAPRYRLLDTTRAYALEKRRTRSGSANSS